jgi:hypothetical protein
MATGKITIYSICAGKQLMECRAFRILAIYLLLVLTSIANPMQKANAQACNPGTPCLTYTKDTGANNNKRGASETCDGDFMNQIYARAWLEAQRENMMNQTYILKTDSVLEYSCFDQLASNGATIASNLFSGSNLWQSRSFPLGPAYTAGGNPTQVNVSVNMGASHINNPMQNVVLNTLSSFVSGNFAHSYTCANMSAIWFISKCDNIPSNAFRTFEELITADPRTLPSACPGTTITQDDIDRAENRGPGFIAATFDPLNANIAYYSAVNTTLHTACSAPIETGLIYETRTYAQNPPTEENRSGLVPTLVTYDEKICPNPGCYYDAPGDRCVALP